MPCPLRHRCYDIPVAALLEVRNLTVSFGSLPTGPQGPPFHAPTAPAVAVRELSFSIAPGEVLGLVGESGSGKSVTSLALMRLLPPQAHVAGQILLTNGNSQQLLELPEPQMRRLRGSSLAMIFQEPMTSLNPVMRVGDQIAEAVLAHNAIPKPEAWDRAVRAMDDVAIADAARRARDYPHQLSGGMRQRIMIAMAIVNHPKLLIADEPTTALDVTIQAQILRLLADLRTKYNLAMLFISHDLAVVSQVADRVAVMYAGNLVEMGTTQAIFRQPAHPYTRGLLSAAPTLTTERRHPLRTIEGSVPGLTSMPPGCPFSPRCRDRISDCDFELPPLLQIAPGHWARCPIVNPVAGLPRGV